MASNRPRQGMLLASSSSSSSTSGQVKRVYGHRGSATGPRGKRFGSLLPASSASRQAWKEASSSTHSSSPLSPNPRASFHDGADNQGDALMASVDEAGPSVAPLRAASRSRSSSLSSCDSKSPLSSIFDDDRRQGTRNSPSHQRNNESIDEEVTPPSSPLSRLASTRGKKRVADAEQGGPTSVRGTRFNGVVLSRAASPNGSDQKADAGSSASPSSLAAATKQQRQSSPPTNVPEPVGLPGRRQGPSRAAKAKATELNAAACASSSPLSELNNLLASQPQHQAQLQVNSSPPALSPCSSSSPLSSAPASPSSQRAQRRLTPPPSASNLSALLSASVSRPDPPANHPGRSIAHARAGAGADGDAGGTGRLLRDGTLLVHQDDEEDREDEGAVASSSSHAAAAKQKRGGRSSRVLRDIQAPQQQQQARAQAPPKEDSLAKRMLKRKAVWRAEEEEEATASTSMSASTAANKKPAGRASTSSIPPTNTASTSSTGPRLIVLRKRGRASAPAGVAGPSRRPQQEQDPTTSDDELSAFFIEGFQSRRRSGSGSKGATATLKSAAASLSNSVRRLSLPGSSSSAPARPSQAQAQRYKLRTPLSLPERSYYARTKREEASPTPGAVDRKEMSKGKGKRRQSEPVARRRGAEDEDEESGQELVFDKKKAAMLRKKAEERWEGQSDVEDAGEEDEGVAEAEVVAGPSNAKGKGAAAMAKAKGKGKGKAKASTTTTRKKPTAKRRKTVH